MTVAYGSRWKGFDSDWCRNFGTRFNAAMQQQLNELWTTFESDLRENIFKYAPSNLQVLIQDPSAIKITRMETGCKLEINTHIKSGKILMVWELGNVNAVPYEIYPVFKQALMFIGKDGEKVFAKKVVFTKVIPPHKFIRTAWKQTIEKFRKRLKRSVIAAAKQASQKSVGGI